MKFNTLSIPLSDYPGSIYDKIHLLTKFCEQVNYILPSEIVEELLKQHSEIGSIYTFYIHNVYGFVFFVKCNPSVFFNNHTYAGIMFSKGSYLLFEYLNFYFN